MIVPAQIEFHDRVKAIRAKWSASAKQREIERANAAIYLPLVLPVRTSSHETYQMRLGWRIIGIKLMNMELDLATRQKITARQIIEIVAHAAGFSPVDIRSDRRQQPLIHARQFAVWMVRKMRGDSTPRIGASFGDRDHTTILHACRKVDERIAAGSLDTRFVEIAQRYGLMAGAAE